MTRCACLVFALVLATVPALANIPYPDLCVLDNAAGSDGAVVYTLPDGSGSAFTAARLGGALVDATLTLTVVNNLGDPINNYPAADMWIVTTAGGLISCDLATPDGNTDPNGQTHWIQPLFGGGHSLGEGTQAIIAGDAVPGPVPVQYLSADMSGDLLVNLTDITTFTQALAVYNPDADFNDDGAVNLTEISMFTPGIGVVCPE